MKNIYRIAWLFVVIFFLISSKVSADNGDNLIWTVQIGSYESLDEAGVSLEKYLSLYPRNHSKLRIENHSPYFALRVGKFADKIAAQNLLSRVKTGFPGALLMRAYFRPQRIVQQTSAEKSAASN
ncbi:MAG: SPOR domain-containing protein, partial [Desulfonatronovibrio sp.]